MFTNRNNTQKPDGEFITRFQQAFSDIVPRRDSTSPRNVRAGEPLMAGLVENNDVKMEGHDVKLPITNNDRTPRNMHELGLTPSWMESASYSMMPLANPHSGFYTPTSSGMGAMFHNQAGDLHTPTGMHLMTPLAGMPAVHNHHSTGFEPFHPQFMNPVHDMNPYTQTQPSYAPSAFMHRDSGYDAMDDTLDDSSLNDVRVETASNITASTEFSTQLAGDMSYAKGEKFRFNVSLRAPTAMVKNLSEIPVTYLNKGQAYNLSVVDTSPPMLTHEPLRYRTFIRISFEEREQRARPSACWQLWKEGRGTTEAHQRGGKLLAVEYVDPLQGGSDAHRNRQVQVESMSVDGFCVTWTANPATGISDCNIPVRFNFLSTDFSHSKGVKGIPVRLCAKTELLSPGEETGLSRDPELSYCKVKLFRDHGAERKLSNDVAHVRKTIDKLKQQVSQAEMGGGFSKRKRGSNFSGTSKASDNSLKPSSHKRTWSMDSDNTPEKVSLEDDLQAKLSTMQEMFSSTRSVSVFGLRGDNFDDPDLYPIQLSGDSDSSQYGNTSRSSTRELESIMPSPPNTNTSSSNSPPTQALRLGKCPTTIQRIPSGDQVSRGFIEAIGVDLTYRPPSERPLKPIACFYVRFTGNVTRSEDYYRAIYLTERTVRNLVKQITEKYHIDPMRISNIMHAHEKGLRVMVDDDVVRQLPEGQDMIVDISEAPGPNGGVSGTPGSPMEINLTY
ncbi:transcriptional regulator family: Grainyhead/CP2 [Penicillium psychrosexuale]|uniref:transcriptional regulator family: Grainyhead/CP2 n=1 Tax=Penicillium psychrosexuale TaxID=1002107 RepID=UPI0025453CA6|nr:transcriptional regulator family: Grainyhead/CP2 [Penicillium psychrosexuale]KAJ5799645.1 transcriptional regulator family: Grainyhead/CP2 [Penicillium psychrosexuale]